MRATLIALALTATLIPATAVASAEPAPERHLAQTIDWKACFPDGPPPGQPAGAERLECGTFTAPLDWNRPGDDATVTVAVSRLRPVGREPRRSLLTNPGGPGAPGRSVPSALLQLDRRKLLDNTEIVGIDLRGTGDSTRASCGGYDWLGKVDPRDRRPANVDRLYDDAERQARECQSASGDLGRHITTEQVVRDLDLLRRLLGREKIDWLGYSAGTWLGAHYATYFPTHVGRFVFDSNTEFTTDWQGAFADFGAGFERRFREDFLPWAAKYHGRYGLGSTGDEVRATYERVRAGLAATPAVLTDGTTYTAGEFDLRYLEAMYRSARFPGAATDLAALRAVVDQPGHRATQEQTRVLAPAKAALKPDDAVYGTQFAMLCNDSRWDRSRAVVARKAERTGRANPFVGYYQLGAPCASWHRPPVHLKTPDGKGVPPVLMVQSVHDPATPLEGAQRAHRKFANSRMLTVTDEGDHALYGRTNGCVNDAVEAFLVDGVVPQRDLTCRGVPLPDPTS